MRRIGLALTVVAFLQSGQAYGSAPLQTDANVLTALDVSDSIDGSAAALQFEGVAKAVLAPEFLQVVSAGWHGRIGFAVYTWAAGRNVRVVLPWTAIGSPDDARRVSRRLRAAAPAKRASPSEPLAASGEGLIWYEFRTDISAAIEHGRQLLGGAPYEAQRQVLNLCANGEDNVGDGPSAARDRALAAGVTVNALALGERTELGSYLRDHVQGGPTSFVLEARAHGDFAEAMLRKFLMDLIAGQRQSSRQAESSAADVAQAAVVVEAAQEAALADEVVEVRERLAEREAQLVGIQLAIEQRRDHLDHRRGPRARLERLREALLVMPDQLVDPLVQAEEGLAVRGQDQAVVRQRAQLGKRAYEVAQRVGLRLGRPHADVW
jgi:Ca-activated chloride channel homolog